MNMLADITVLDLSRVFAAPLSTQMLSDLGARVWKIESLRGDDTRKWGDHVFNSFNRGKKSLALDLKDPRAQDIVRRLAAKADVLIENFKTGDLARYGLSYESLSALNERLIYLSLTGFGNTGPRRHQPGYDTIVQAMSGAMSVTGEADGPPTRVGIAWIDVMSGLVAASGILSALYERTKSGKGQHIDLSLFDVGMMALVDAAQDYLQNGNVQHRVGNITRNISPAQVFQAADGWIVLAIGNDDQFRRLCQAVGRPEIADDARFESNLSRVKHRQALSDMLVPLLRRQSRDHWVEALTAATVAVSPVLDVGEALRDRQADARQAVWTLADQDGAPVKSLANPLRHMSRTPARPAGPPPRLGEHTGAVLSKELGMESEEIAALVRDGVIHCGECEDSL